jgi:S-adenosylmethionine synthetase
VSKGIVFIAAQFASKATVDVAALARDVIHRVGYDSGDFNAKTCSILTSINELPMRERAVEDERGLDGQGLDRIVARDQASTFGFACTQTAALMPLPIWLAHKLARRLASVRLGSRSLPYLAPDGKTQVTVEYRRRRPFRIHSLTVIAATRAQQGKSPPDLQLHGDILEYVVGPAFADEPVKPDASTRLFISSGETLLIGGPAMHSGLTGRKTAIDTYGEYARHSGAALSGKDPGRIDRIGTYAARHAAKCVVRAGLADECEVQLSYSIGLAAPVSIQLETFGTGVIPDSEIADRLRAVFDFRVGGIIRRFNLRHLPTMSKGRFYVRLAAYGQVGRMDMGLPWEVTDAAELLQHADRRSARPGLR